MSDHPRPPNPIPAPTHPPTHKPLNPAQSVTRGVSTQRKPSPDDLPSLVRARDLKAMGLTRTDAERVMHLCGGYVRLGKAVYVRRVDVERVLAEAETTGLR